MLFTVFTEPNMQFYAFDALGAEGFYKCFMFFFFPGYLAIPLESTQAIFDLIELFKSGFRNMYENLFLPFALYSIFIRY